jgi:hypothetical protein
MICHSYYVTESFSNAKDIEKKRTKTLLIIFACVQNQHGDRETEYRKKTKMVEVL